MTIINVRCPEQVGKFCGFTPGERTTQYCFECKHTFFKVNVNTTQEPIYSWLTHPREGYTPVSDDYTTETANIFDEIGDFTDI